MNIITKFCQKTLPCDLASAAILAGMTLMVALPKQVLAVAAAKPTPLQVFCDANAMNTAAFPEMPGSLKCTPVPEPYTLDAAGNKASISPSIIKNKAKLIALGKILFWDSQVGSDGLACASCHASPKYLRELFWIVNGFACEATIAVHK